MKHTTTNMKHTTTKMGNDDENDVGKYLDSTVHGTGEDLTLANSKTRYTTLMTDERLCTDHVVHAPHLYQYHYAHLQRIRTTMHDITHITIHTCPTTQLLTLVKFSYCNWNILNINARMATPMCAVRLHL